MIKYFPIILIVLTGCMPNIIKEKASIKPFSMRSTLSDLSSEQQYVDYFSNHPDWWTSFCDYLKTHPEIAAKLLAKLHDKSEFTELTKYLFNDTEYFDSIVNIFLNNSIPIPSTTNKTITGAYIRQKHGNTNYDIPILGYENIEANTLTIEPRKIINNEINLIIQFNTINYFFPVSATFGSSGLDITFSGYHDLDRSYIKIGNINQNQPVNIVLNQSQLFPISVKIMFKCILGDVDYSGYTNNDDRNLIISKYGQSLDEYNFQCDINLDGKIDEKDLMETYYSNIPESEGLKIKIK